MLKALKKLEEEIQNEAPRKANLKRANRELVSNPTGIRVAANVRRNRVTWDLADEKTPTPEPVERNMRKRKMVEDRSERTPRSPAA